MFSSSKSNYKDTTKKNNSVTLEVCGRAATIYVSTSIQENYIQNNRHLIPWNGDNSRLIDRYDARNLLHSVQEWKGSTLGKRKQVIGAEERELDKLRYYDLFHKPTVEEEEEEAGEEENDTRVYIKENRRSPVATGNLNIESMIIL